MIIDAAPCPRRDLIKTWRGRNLIRVRQTWVKFTGHSSCSILAWTGQGTFDILTRAQLPGHIYYPGMLWSGYSKYPSQATQPVLRHVFLVIPRRSLSSVPLISWPGYDCQATFNTLASPGQGSWSSLVRPHDQSYAAYPWSYPGIAWPGYGSGFAVLAPHVCRSRERGEPG